MGRMTECLFLLYDTEFSKYFLIKEFTLETHADFITEKKGEIQVSTNVFSWRLNEVISCNYDLTSK